MNVNEVAQCVMPINPDFRDGSIDGRREHLMELAAGPGRFDQVAQPLRNRSRNRLQYHTARRSGPLRSTRRRSATNCWRKPDRVGPRWDTLQLGQQQLGHQPTYPNPKLSSFIMLGNHLGHWDIGTLGQVGTFHVLIVSLISTLTGRPKPSW